MKFIKYSIFSLIIICTLIFVYFVTYTKAEPKAYDYMTKNVLLGTFENPLFVDKNKNIYGHENIILIVIDDKSTERYRWPWKRELYCGIFNYLHEYAKPKVIAHDSITITLDKDNPNSDKKYFETLKNTDNLVVGTFLNGDGYSDKKAGEEYDKFFLSKYSYPIQNGLELLPNQTYNSLLRSPKEYLNVIKNIGSVMVIPGAISGDLDNSLDEIQRNQEYFVRYKNQAIPSLAMRIFLLANNNPSVNITKNYIEFPELNYKIKHKITKYQSIVPIRYYQLWHGYSHQKISAIDILDSYELLKKEKEPIINPEIFKDKIVIIGANVPAGSGLNDNRNSPVSANHPGVDIQACSIDNLLNNDFLNIIPQHINVLITIMGMLIVYLIIRYTNIIQAITGTIFFILLYFILSSICFYNGIVINVITPIVMFIMTTIIAFTNNFRIENKNKEKVQNAMGKYMSKDVMKLIVKNIDSLGLGGKKAVVTVLFSDIRGFTSLSEKMSAQQVSELLNEYFTEMETVITKHNGIINKFIGDAIMAVFGEPIQDEKHPINAVLCGLEMLEKVNELHKKWEKEEKPMINIGIGINTGEVFIGNIGSINRMEYTVIGDTVNLASRLESYNKTYNTHMLISACTYEASKNYITAREIKDVEIRGKAEKLNIYDVQSRKDIDKENND